MNDLPAFEAGCRMPTERSIVLSDANYRTAAQIASEQLLLALLRYGATHGLPNIAADDCMARLKDLGSPPANIRQRPNLRPLGHRRTREDSWTTEQHAKAVELRQRGLSYGRIGYEIGRSYDAVAARLREYGVQPASSIDVATG